MPLFDHPSARLYYQDVGQGPAILATHGVAENHLYWTLPGVAESLAAAGYRVVTADMRGHGRSLVTGEPKGFDVDTVAADIGALADHLGLTRFHLLTHATGGMAGLRYAMGNHRRLLSLMSTNTGSATIPTDGAAAVTDAAATRFEAFIGETQSSLGPLFRGRSWLQILGDARAFARQDPFLNSLHLASDPAQAFAWYEACARLGDPDTLADFMDSFYTDPNPHIGRLRALSCPTLVLAGVNDRMFLEPSRQQAREIPNARLVVLEGRGHMLAFEDPERLTAELLDFLRTATAADPA
jgi:pimeloyl-ACP methyl ester carboxylesterase